MHLPPPTATDVEHFKQCPLAQRSNHLATWKPEDNIAQHTMCGPTALPANEVLRLMQQPQIKEAVLRGAVPLQLYRFIAPDPKMTVRHMQLTAVKRADAQVQQHVEL